MHACSFGFKVLNFEKLKKLVFLISQLCGMEGMLKKKILMHSHPQNVQIYEGCTKHFC